MLPKELRRPFWRAADPVFTPVFLVSLALHCAGAACVVMHPAKPAEEPFAEAWPFRPDRRVSTPRTVKTAAKGKSGDRPPSSDSALRAKGVRSVQDVGLIPLLAPGRTGAAWDDLLGEKSGASAAEEAIKASQLRLATTAPEVGSARGEASGRAQGVEPIGSAGAGTVRLGDEQRDGAPRDLRAPTQPTKPGGDFPSEELERFVRARLKAFQWCYEREIIHHPDLRGRLVVRFTVTPRGRAEEIGFPEDALGSRALDDCIRTLIGRWIFPVHPDEDWTVDYPFIFAPAR